MWKVVCVQSQDLIWGIKTRSGGYEKDIQILSNFTFFQDQVELMSYPLDAHSDPQESCVVPWKARQGAVPDH